MLFRSMWGGVHVGEGPGGHLPARHRLRAGPDCVALEQNPLALREDYCGRSSFTEAIAQLPARARTTRRLRTAIGAGIGDATRLVAEVTQAHGVSWPTAHRAFVATPKRCWSSRKPTPVLGIDETRRGKPRWERCAATGRSVRVDPWDTGFVDPAGDQGLPGQRDLRQVRPHALTGSS